MRLRHALIVLSTFVAAPAVAGDEPDPVGEALIACAPTTYEAALDCLDAHLSARSKDGLRKPGGTTTAHFGLGMWIRNNWGLWKGGPLAQDMKGHGVSHPDNMSGIILDGYAARLQKRPYDIATELRRSAEIHAAGTKACATGQRVGVEDGRFLVCTKRNGINQMHFEQETN